MTNAPEHLVEVFKELGVSDPEGWALSEAREGIDQIARATVLRALADLVEAAGKPETMLQLGKLSTNAHVAIEKLRSTQADMSAVSELCLQSAFDAIYQFLRIAGGMNDPIVNPGNVEWTIVRVDHEGSVMGEIPALYESWSGVLCDVLDRKEL